MNPTSSLNNLPTKYLLILTKINHLKFEQSIHKLCFIQHNINMRKEALLIIFVSLIQLAFTCQDLSCEICSSSVTNGTLSQICESCFSGYKLDGDGVCIKDIGLIIGISIGAAAAVAAQIIGYCICKMKNQQKDKKKSAIKLQNIYNPQDSVSSQKQRNDPIGQTNNNLQGVRQQQGQQQQSDGDKLDIKTQYKIYVERHCSICEKPKTSIKTNCNHYFHHDCFIAEVMNTRGICPYERCNSRNYSPIQMICKGCLNKKRSVPTETINDFTRFQEYYCVGCKIIRKKEQDEKKWWKTIFAPKVEEQNEQKYEQESKKQRK